MSEAKARLSRKGVPSCFYTDNGFSSRNAMDAAHRIVLETVSSVSVSREGNVLDLGCGNGELLRKMTTLYPHCIPHGVDVSSERISHARALHPKYPAHFEVCSMFDLSAEWFCSGRAYTIAFLMPGRLLEVTEADRLRILQAVKERCAALVVYFYGGWKEPDADLACLAKRCELQPSKMHLSGCAALAEFVSSSRSRAFIPDAFSKARALGVIKT
jgi:methyltransferase family protein